MVWDTQGRYLMQSIAGDILVRCRVWEMYVLGERDWERFTVYVEGFTHILRGVKHWPEGLHQTTRILKYQVVFINQLLTSDSLNLFFDC